jgi:2-dehydropantoate 2-reductase
MSVARRNGMQDDGFPTDTQRIVRQLDYSAMRRGARHGGPFDPDCARIAVVGAGAMGSIFGAALTEAGFETTFIDVSVPLVDRLRSRGLIIIDEAGERRMPVQATTDPRSVGVVDLVLFWVKCYHTENAARLASPLVGPETVVASLQNGWGNGEVLTEFFAPEQIAVGVTYDSGTVIEPGRIAHTHTAETLIGPYVNESLDDARWTAEIVSSAGLRIGVTLGIRAAIWEKLVMTAATLPTSALTGLTSAALGEAGPMLGLVDGLAIEALDTARAAGYELNAGEQLEKLHSTLASAGEGKASMLQDVEAGRRTEIDVINGAVVREAEARRIEVPLNLAMVALIKGYERAHGLT